MSLRDDALQMHKENQGKLEITPNIKVTNKEELSLGELAQLGEHLPYKQRVGGSNPSFSTI